MKSTVSVVIMLSLALLLCSCQPKEDSRIGELESRVEALEEEVKVIKEATQNSKAKKIATRENQTEAEVIINQEKEIVLGEPISLCKDEYEAEICLSSVQKIVGSKEYAQWYADKFNISEKEKESWSEDGSLDNEYLFFEIHIKNTGTLPCFFTHLLDKIDIKQNKYSSEYFNLCFDDRYNYGVNLISVRNYGEKRTQWMTDVNVGLFEEKIGLLYIQVPEEFDHSSYKLSFKSNGTTYSYEGKQ